MNNSQFSKPTVPMYDKDCSNSKHAYCIMAHSNPDLLALLISVLDNPRNDIYIMIDRKTDINQFTHINAQKSKLVWCNNRTNVLWGHVSQVENELNVFETAINGGEYTWFHLLSGIDFPIKSQDYIHKFFEKNTEREFLAIAKGKDAEAILADKLDQYHILSKYYRRNNKLVNHVTGFIRRGVVSLQKTVGYKRKYPYDVMMKGSNWCTISDSFDRLLLQNREQILKQYKGTFCPDEVYKQTLAFNSSFRERIAPEGNMRLIDWTRGKPYTFQPSDIDEMKSSEALFTRKVTKETAEKIIQEILTNE